MPHEIVRPALVGSVVLNLTAMDGGRKVRAHAPAIGQTIGQRLDQADAYQGDAYDGAIARNARNRRNPSNA
jgi:hypothetical protein